MQLRYFAIPLALALAACSSNKPHGPDDHWRKDHPSMHKEFRAMIEHHFAMMDQNGDGVVSRTEYLQFHTDHFDAMDKNGDEQLTLEEMKPPRPPK